MFTKQEIKHLLWPLVVEQMLVVLVGMADTIMVSSAGEQAVSGVSLVELFNVLFINLLTALATGGTVVVGQYLGRQDIKQAELAGKQLFYVVSGSGCLLCLICVLWHSSILQLFYPQLEPIIFTHAKTYFFLTALSYPAMALYNWATALFRAIGNSRISMLCSALMNGINIVGNGILIYGFHLDVLGAALSTLFARWTAALVMYILIRRNEHGMQMESPLHFFWQGRMVKNILRIGIPGGLENSMFQIGKLLVGGLIAGLGTSAIAADAVTNSLAAIGNIPGNAIGMAMVTVVSRCIGAGNGESAIQNTRKMLRLNYLCIWPIDLILIFFAPQLAGLFSLTEEGIGLASAALRIYAVAAMLIWPQSWALPNALRAAGDARFPMITALISMWLCRILCSYVFCYWGWGLAGIWIAMDLDWAVRTVFFVWRFRQRKWLHQKAIR